MNKKSLSVVILTYNSCKTIGKCLRSLENQENKDFEILIVDDDSTDDTLKIVKSFFSKSKIPLKY